MRENNVIIRSGRPALVGMSVNVVLRDSRPEIRWFVVVNLPYPWHFLAEQAIPKEHRQVLEATRCRAQRANILRAKMIKKELFQFHGKECKRVLLVVRDGRR